MTKIKHYRAAGGVVVDDAGRVLMIERDVERAGRMVHEVRLPKGKLEKGETDGQAALREVGEESGYWELEILADLGENTVEFELNGKRVRRDDHYYLMQLTSTEYAGQQMKPGSDEALFEPVWAADFDDAERRLTYAGERDFIRRAKEKWNR